MVSEIEKTITCQGYLNDPIRHLLYRVCAHMSAGNGLRHGYFLSDIIVCAAADPDQRKNILHTSGQASFLDADTQVAIALTSSADAFPL